jgi:hypothetical protein
MDLLRPRLAAFAQERAAVLLEAHSRVRVASRTRAMKHRVETQDTPDVLGLFVFLPKGVA